jgi:hypothetical protein
MFQPNRESSGVQVVVVNFGVPELHSHSQQTKQNHKTPKLKQMVNPHTQKYLRQPHKKNKVALQ